MSAPSVRSARRATNTPPMSDTRFIAGDWGTTHLRLFLCDESGKALDTATGPGAKALHSALESASSAPNPASDADALNRATQSEAQTPNPTAAPAATARNFATAFDSLVERWVAPNPTTSPNPPMPAILCGMVGSTIGWREAPYLKCPARPQDIAAACASLRHGQIRIIPGLSCQNRFGAPDVMRGEETQILGALQLQPDLRHGRHLLCLPGTHTKWALLEDGIIHDFLTAPTGELFTLLREHSVLVPAPRAPDPQTPPTHSGTASPAHATHPAFERALLECARFPAAQALHRLFECRSRVLAGDLESTDAAAYLSGLLIASDIAGALSLFVPALPAPTVHLIGAPALTTRYTSALARQNYSASITDGALAALAGLAHVHAQLTQEPRTDAT